MSSETVQWLNENVLTGYGHTPWHFVEGESTPPFAGAVPLQAALNMCPVYVSRPEGYLADDGSFVADEGRQRILAVRGGKAMGLGSVHGEGYAIHQPSDTVLGLLEEMVSFGVLREGQGVWAQYGHPDVVTTPEGVRFQAKILATTGADGFSSSLREVVTLAECDNTLAAAMNETEGRRESVRHTRLSVPRVEDMRARFGLLDEVVDSFAATIAADVRNELTTSQVDRFLSKMFPLTAPGVEVVPRSTATQKRKRDAVSAWYTGKFAGWKGTEFGILQAFDAAARWDFKVSGNAQEANMVKVISGEWDQQMSSARKALRQVTMS